MNINLTPVFYFLTKYSRKSRLKILLGVLGMVILGIILSITMGFLGANFLAKIIMNCVFYGILAMPFLLLALIPKQQKEKSKGMPNITKVVSSIKSEYKKNQKNLRPATPKERLFFGGLLLLVALICFCIGGIAILGGIFWLGIAISCFCSSIPVKVKSHSVPLRPKDAKIGIIIGIGFVIIGVLVSTFMTVGKITCSKGVIRECEFQEQHLWELNYKTKSKLPLENLKGAFIERQVNHSEDGESITYYVVLKTNSGNQRLFNSSSSSRSTHENQANKINQFLNSDQETLEIKESRLWLFFPLIFVIVGGWLLWYDLTFLLKKSNVKASTKMKGKK